MFLLVAEFLKPQSAAAPAQYTLENFRTAYLSGDNAACSSTRCSSPSGRGAALVVGTGLAWMNNVPYPIQDAVLSRSPSSRWSSRHPVHVAWIMWRARRSA